MLLKYSKVREVYNPSLAYGDPAGIDVYIPNEFPSTWLVPGDNTLIPTGLKLNIPDGYYVEVKNRSSIASKTQLIVGACIIDNDYQGEVFIDIHNIGMSRRNINPGDKIAQFVLHKKHSLTLQEVGIESLYDKETARGEGSLGSSD
jgi:dUTP pyrophosphatase